MQVVSPQEVARALPYRDLVERLREVYSCPSMVARRELVSLESCGIPGACMGLMPAFGPGYDVVTKIFTLFPGNRDRGLATVQAVVVVFDKETGRLKAVMDGTEVTRRRTAAMCALASSYLSRSLCERLLVCGAGSLASHAALAHASVRPIRAVSIWARRAEAAQCVVEIVSRERPDLEVSVTADLRTACEDADVISCQTSASEPIIFGDWIREGSHMDFVGSHDPDRRECDDVAVARSRVFVDVMETALREAGDILIPIANGAIRADHVLGDLADLCRDSVVGRRRDSDITLFKSTGSSLADLAAASLVAERIM